MIAKLGGDLKDGRGSSFKELFRYVFFDKRGSRLSRRVDWAEALNCTLAGDPRRAWFEMFTTWAARTALKLAAGIALTGRDNGRPVLHLTLAWAPHQTPDRHEMMGAATEVLDWLGLSDHQAVVVAHNDEPQPHIHIVANTVHPLTGKTASLYRCKRTLSAWAVQWEERHGGIIIESRVTNRLAGTTGPLEIARAAQPATQTEPAPEVPMTTVAASSPPRVEATNDNTPIVRLVVASPSRKAPAPSKLRARFRRLAFVLAIAAPIVALFARAAGPPERDARGHDLRHANAPPRTVQPATDRTSPARYALRL